MKVLVVLIFGFAAVAAQNETVDAEKILLPCCSVTQQIAAQNLFFQWILQNNNNCDPLFQCLFKCMGFFIVPPTCVPNTALHIQFNIWLLNNYKCLPNKWVQCFKGCIQYNAWRPCPIISVPIDTSFVPTK